jgi:hypothetical protein
VETLHVLRLPHSAKDTLKVLFEKEKMLPFRKIYQASEANRFSTW